MIILAPFLQLLGLTVLVTLISLSAELYIDIRHEQRKTKQDKTGQMPWRIVSLGFGLITANLIFYGIPNSFDIWQFWGLIGQCTFATGLYWISIDTIMAKYLGQDWDYVGTTSDIDVEFKDSHLIWKFTFMTLGLLLMLTTVIQLG